LAEAEHKRRTPYVVDLLWRDVKRNKQRQALRLSSGTWNPDYHPELAQGGALPMSKNSAPNPMNDSRMPSAETRFPEVVSILMAVYFLATA
jgi:hypothetical protein